MKTSATERVTAPRSCDCLFQPAEDGLDLLTLGGLHAKHEVIRPDDADNQQGDQDDPERYWKDLVRGAIGVAGYLQLAWSPRVRPQGLFSVEARSPTKRTFASPSLAK